MVAKKKGSSRALKKAPAAAPLHVLEHHDRITAIHEADKRVHDKIMRSHNAEYSPEHSHSMSGVSMFRSHAGTKHHQHDLRKAVKDDKKPHEPSIRVSVTTRSSHKSRNSHANKNTSNSTSNAAAPSASSRMRSASPALRVATHHQPKEPTVPVAFNLSVHKPRPPRATDTTNSRSKKSVTAAGYKPKVVAREALYSGHDEKASYSPKHPHREEHKQVHNHTCEQILNDQLLRMMALLLKSQLAKTSHDPVAVGAQMRERAAELVEKELSSLIHNLVKVQGPSGMHKNHALGQLCIKLTNELQREIFTDERAVQRQKALAASIRLDEQDKATSDMHSISMAKDQEIVQLKQDIKNAKYELETVSRHNKVMETELESLARAREQFNESAVELRMQGLDFKARVDNRSARVLHAISTRMGFVPEIITKEINVLKSLKAPGDPEYNKMLEKVYTKKSLKLMKNVLGGMPHVITDHDEEGDIYVEPLSGRRLHPDGTPADVQSERQVQQLHDIRRSSGASPARPSHAKTHARQAAEHNLLLTGSSGQGDAEAKAKRNSTHGVRSASPPSHKPWSTQVNVVNVPTAYADAKDDADATADAKVGIAERERSNSSMAKDSPSGNSASSSGSGRAISGRGRAPKSQDDWVRWAHHQGVHGKDSPNRQAGMSNPQSHGVGTFPNMVLEDVDQNGEDGEAKSDSTYEPSEQSADEDEDEGSDEDSYEYDAEGDRFVTRNHQRYQQHHHGHGNELDGGQSEISEDTYTIGKGYSYPAGTFVEPSSSSRGVPNMQDIYPGASIRLRAGGNVESNASQDNVDDRDDDDDDASDSEEESEEEEEEDGEDYGNGEGGRAKAELEEVQEFIRQVRHSRGISDQDVALLNEAMQEIEEEQSKQRGGWGARK